jgi:copper homeostasis protein
MTRALLEVCVDSVEGALAAERGGAARIELCAGLVEGGTTPSLGLIRAVRARVRFPVVVLLRPRAGDFLYSDAEREALADDLGHAREAGAWGVALGLLAEDGDVDVERTRELVRRARPMAVTFHRAFDLVRDPHAALEDLVRAGVDRVLTSGQERAAPVGAALLRELVARAGDRIVVMAGAGVRAENVRALVEATGVREVHASARSPRASAMRFRNPRASLGAAGPPGADYERLVTDETRVRALAEALSG